MRRVLIANRGEIALRILRTCQAMGIETVAAFTKADKELRHLDLATDTVCIGESSYLEPQGLVSAALSRGCDAVHPGYGLLSENAGFAELATEKGLTFIGPSPEVMRVMGDKIAARNTVKSLGLSVIEGVTVDGLDEARSWAESAGFPVIVKAAHGGGGRGMRLVKDASALDAAVAGARGEAVASFGSDAVYLEKYLGDSRHVEVQVLGDGKGNAIHFGTRDCTVQRSYQKVIEEAPAPFIDAADLEAVAASCADVAAKLEYAGAGTFEFLFDGRRFYFIEMNTRLQVEHPVTEAITGVDLVREQIEVARSGALSMTQADVSFSGHAIECRINAEKVLPDGSVEPSPGQVASLIFPGGRGVRVDSHLYAGYHIPFYYDSLIAKIIAHDETRDAAGARMKFALRETVISGIETNIDWLEKLISSDPFQSGDLRAVTRTGTGRAA